MIYLRYTKTKTAVVPKYSTRGSAGLDLYMDPEVFYTVEPNAVCLVSTGISIEIRDGYFGAIFERSSLHGKGLALSNKVGVIDSDYRGVLKMALRNITDLPIEITADDPRFRAPLCQLVIQPCPRIGLEEVDILSETPRGSGGFGSSDFLTPLSEISHVHSLKHLGEKVRDWNTALPDLSLNECLIRAKEEFLPTQNYGERNLDIETENVLLKIMLTFLSEKRFPTPREREVFGKLNPLLKTLFVKIFSDYMGGICPLCGKDVVREVDRKLGVPSCGCIS